MSTDTEIAAARAKLDWLDANAVPSHATELRRHARAVLDAHDAAVAERDALRALLADIRESLGHVVARDRVVDPVYDPAVARLSASLGGGGYGAIMDAAARLWRSREEIQGAEFVVGPCRATVDRWITAIDAALAGGAS